MEQDISRCQTLQMALSLGSKRVHLYSVSLLKAALLLFMLVALFAGLSSAVEAQLVEEKTFEYDRFFADAENILASNPKLLPQFFYGLVDLKGNRRSAKAQIQREIFACHIGVDTSACQIKRMARLKKEREIPNLFQVPVQLVSVTSKRVKRGQHLVTFTWRPKLIDVEHWSLKEFQEYFNFAEDSAYYKFKEDITSIVFTPQFERKFQVYMTTQEAKVFVTLYQNPPADGKDLIVFQARSASVKIDGSVARLQLNLKAKQLIANHLKLKL